MDLSLLDLRFWGGVIRLLQEYFEWSHTGPRSLAVREERLRIILRSLAGLLLAIDADQDEASCRPGPCECGGRFHSKGKRSRTLVTTVGEVKYHRRYYECTGCGAHRTPVDEAWEIKAGCLSPLAKQESVDLSSALPYREAGYWLERLGGVGVSVMTVWRAAQEAGEKLVEAERARRAESQSREGARSFLAAMREKGSVLRPVVAVDGVYIRIKRAWKEVKIAVVGELNEEGEWVKGRTSYLATTESAELFRPMVVWHALDRGITRWSEVVLLSDGADWIATLTKRFYPKGRQIVDYWHAKQYLWQAAHLLFGEGNAQAAAFVEEVKELLWMGEIQTLADRVEAERKRRRIENDEAIDALGKTMQYLLDRSEALQYDALRKQGNPTGSGAVEGACKNLVQSRMKRSGMNWSLAGAENILALRAKYCERMAAL